AAAALAEQTEQQDEAAALAEIPGAELLSAKKGEGRVAIRFNLAARKAVEEAPRQPYLEKVAASDNLRWSLTGGQVAADEKPLGRQAKSFSVGDAGDSSDQ
ncbi:MAG: hypothetical protein ABIP91_08405, partial [Sphingomicrobium sp.]